MLKSLMESPMLWALSFLCTIVGLIITVATRKKQEITYARSDFGIISLKKRFSEDVQVLFQGQYISNLSISNIAIWNSGNETILQNSFVSKKPLSIILENGGEILDVSVLCETDSDNTIKIQSRTDTSVSISMEYLKPKDGAVIQILHTGKQADLRVDCKLKAGRPLKEYDYLPIIRNFLLSRKIAKRLSTVILSTFSFVLFGMFIASLLAKLEVIPAEWIDWLVHNSQALKTPKEIINEWVYILGIYLAILLPLVYTVLRIDHKFGIPKVLKSYTNLE